MAESQPGTVASFDPSISLTNFTAETRDQLIFNENQLVLAKLQQARPTSASPITREGSTALVEYAEYFNTSGKFAYIDSSFQALNTTGNPTTPVHQIVIGFDQQVTTDTIIFWSISFVDTTKIFVEYSFDNVTWFAAGTVSWVQFFDDTIEVFPGDIPPTGEFRYTGTIGSGDITARYWRIRGDATAVFSSESGTNPNKTYTVDDTTNFATTGTMFTTFGTTSRTITYTGKSATTFTGVDDSNDIAGTATITAIAGTNGDLTLTLSSVTNFPTVGAVVYGSDNGTDPNSLPAFTITYDSVVASTLIGATVTPDLDEVVVISTGGGDVFTTVRTLINDAKYDVDYAIKALAPSDTLYTLFEWGSGVTEVQIIPTLNPILQHWASDGTQAVTNAVEGTDYYAMAYDANDDVYYALRFNDTLNATLTQSPDDDFNTGADTSFDSVLWTEDLTNTYFQRNVVSGTLDHKSVGGDGQLVANYGITGDFTADIELVALLDLPTGAYFSLEARDFITANVHQMSGALGPYSPSSPTASGTFFGSTMTFTDTVAGAASLQDFRIDPSGMDFSFAGGIVDYNLVYSTSLDEYAVTVSGIVHPPAKPGVPYQMDSASFTVSNLGTPADGQGFVALVFVAEDPMEANPLASGISLQIERIGTNGYCRYVDSTNIGVTETVLVGNVPTDDMRIQLYGSPSGGATIDLGADNFDLTSSTLVYDSPVFSVVTIDKLGNLVQVSGISDVDGFAIKTFDIISDPSVVYNRFLTPRAGIATNGLSSGGGGEIYIKIDTVLYKYLKSALPLTTETGSGAAATTTGEIPATAITGFAYNGFSGGGLSYIEFDSDLSGVFVRTIDTITLTAVALKALLDVSDITPPFAWNVSDLSTLYFVSGTNDLKLYDLNATKAAFVNVTSDKQVLAAGTLETATVTAQVLNVYGQVRSNKSMTFTVSAGDGAVSPAVGCSDVNGEDTTTYTVGSAVGTSTITVTVSDTAC